MHTVRMRKSIPCWASPHNPGYHVVILLATRGGGGGGGGGNMFFVADTKFLCLYLLTLYVLNYIKSPHQWLQECL
jgi:hypothetical protein